MVTGRGPGRGSPTQVGPHPSRGLLGSALVLAARRPRGARLARDAGPRPSVAADSLLGPTHPRRNVRLPLNSTVNAIFSCSSWPPVSSCRGRTKQTIAIFFSISVVLQYLSNPTNLIRDLLLAVIISAGLTFRAARLGVVALIVTLCFLSWNVPVPGEASAWYTATCTAALLALVAVVAYGFQRSLAGPPSVERDPWVSRRP
jgi:hypothetical protein